MCVIKLTTKIGDDVLLPVYRCLKHCILHAWIQFVPLSKEEKIKELRRAEMRRKVAAWLPDYQPRNFGQEQDSEPD